VETGWTVDIDVASDETESDDTLAAEFAARIGAFEEVLEPYGGAAAGGDACDRYGARFSIDTTEDDPAEVLEHALLIFRDAAFAAELPRWPIVRCEILTYDEDDRRSEDDGA
jgi:hypothetical protein